MTRARLQLLLSSALFAAIAPGCGSNVATESSDDGGTKEDTRTSADTYVDTATPSDTGGSVDTSTPPSDSGTIDTSPVDMGACTPIPVNDACNERVTYPCGLPFVPTMPGPTNEECQKLCAPVTFSGGPPSFIYCNVASDPGGSALVYCTSCAVGRKPGDLLDNEPCGVESGDSLGLALAEMARVEAASVHAFRRLDRSLGELGADDHLRGRVRRAARDEIAHARRVSRLATARGARPRPVRIARGKAPSTFELALENAVEGCVHETIGVAYLEHQKKHAADPELRELAVALYDDELDHAALSWDLVAFFDQHLTTEERETIRRASARALDNVVTEIGRVDPTVSRALGLPSRAVVAQIVDNLRETLFAA